MDIESDDEHHQAQEKHQAGLFGPSLVTGLPRCGLLASAFSMLLYIAYFSQNMGDRYAILQVGLAGDATHDRKHLDQRAQLRL